MISISYLFLAIFLHGFLAAWKWVRSIKSDVFSDGHGHQEVVWGGVHTNSLLQLSEQNKYKRVCYRPLCDVNYANLLAFTAKKLRFPGCSVTVHSSSVL